MIPQNQGKIIVRNNHKEHYLTNQEKPYPNKCKQKINEKLKESKHYEIENMKKNKKNAQLPRRNFEFNFQIKKKKSQGTIQSNTLFKKTQTQTQTRKSNRRKHFT